MPFCHTIPLLPSVAQQNIMDNSLEGLIYTAITPVSASDIMEQCSKIGGITFGAAFKFSKNQVECSLKSVSSVSPNFN